MRVALDTNGLFTAQAGVARYIRGLRNAIRSSPAAGVELAEVAWEVENFGYAQPTRALKTAYRELVWARTVGRMRLRAASCELLHSPVGWFLTPLRGQKCVVTVHDMAAFTRPERFRPWQRHAAQRAYRNAARADRLICISQFTADETMRVLGFPASKLEVVHLGSEFHPDDAPSAEEQPDAPLPTDFFLFVGSLEPGKNLPLLQETYRLARAKGMSLPPLVIVGARWEGVPGEGKPPADWYYLGRQPDAALAYLYRRARALVFPSLYEGFGLPPVEAMSLRCPVICSKVASLPEVTGDAALMVDMTPEAYAEGMRRLRDHPTLRDELIAAGIERCRRFSWRRCAEETTAIYQSVLGV